jgi:glutathione S-transferase
MRRREFIRVLGRLLRFMDGHLAGRMYLAVEHPTIADLACYSYVAHANEGGISLDRYAKFLKSNVGRASACSPIDCAPFPAGRARAHARGEP